MRKLVRVLWIVGLMSWIAACSPAAPATEEAAITEAPVQPSATPIVRQPEGETLVFTAGIAVFTVPNPDGRWELRDMQGDRLVPTNESQVYNVRLSAIREFESFEERVTTLAGEAELSFAEASGRRYATIQRPGGLEYMVDAGDVILVGSFTVPAETTVTAPERNAVLEALLGTSVDFID